MSDAVYFQYDEREHETDNAVLFIKDGEKVWVPKSVIDDEDENDKVAIIQEWWARKEGLKSDW